MILKRLLICLLALPIAALANPIDSLTEDEFKAAGLHKLTEQELKTLNELLGRSQQLASGEKAGEADPGAAESGMHIAAEKKTTNPSVEAETSLKPRDDLYGKEQLAVDTRKAPKRIESRLVGTFKGWFGSTTFKLENGQVWMQRIRDVQKYRPSENPKVTVFKSAGGYRIRIEGYRQTCPVKRIK